MASTVARTGLYRTLETPRSTEELRALCEAGRAEHNLNADGLAVISSALNNYLRRSLPNGALASTLVARRVTRHLKYAAELNTTAAQAFLRCWHDYERLVLNARDTGNAPFQI